MSNQSSLQVDKMCILIHDKIYFLRYYAIMDTKIITITDFVRKFGQYADMLSSLVKIILTRKGRPFAEVKATPQEKNRKLLALINTWDGRLFENEAIWKKVLTRRNRKRIVKI